MKNAGNSSNVIDAAIRSVKKEGIIIVMTKLGNIIMTSQPLKKKIVKGNITGTGRDRADLVKLANNSDLKVVVGEHKLVETNEVLADLKQSDIKTCTEYFSSSLRKN